MLHFVMVVREKWVFLFALGVLFFNWPLLIIFEPSLPHYMFGMWGVLILAAWLLATFSGRSGTG